MDSIDSVVINGNRYSITADSSACGSLNSQAWVATRDTVPYRDCGVYRDMNGNVIWDTSGPVYQNEIQLDEEAVRKLLNMNKEKTMKPKKTKKRKIIVVKFDNYYKEYTFFTDLDVEEGCKYDIVASDGKTYSNPVTIIKVDYADASETYRTITEAKLISAGPRPDDNIYKVVFDEDAGVTVVIWKDKTKTIVRCGTDDVFDKEKAIALCYMKKQFNNRACFNEVFKKWCIDE